MEPNSREFYKQCSFQKYCNAVLHNEACDAHRELRTHKAKEVTFSDMTLDEARQLHTFDEYFKRETAETVFEKAGKKITPKLLLDPYFAGRKAQSHIAVLFRGNERYRNCRVAQYTEKHNTVQTDKLF